MTHVTRMLTRKLPHRVASFAAEPTSAASKSADTTDAAAVMRHMEQSSRLLPPRADMLPTIQPARASKFPVPTSSMPSTSTAVSLQLPAPMPSSTTAVPAAPPLVSDDSDMDALVSDLLVVESHTPMPTYSVVNMPLGANLSDFLKSKIRKHNSC